MQASGRLGFAVLIQTQDSEPRAAIGNERATLVMIFPPSGRRMPDQAGESKVRAPSHMGCFLRRVGGTASRRRILLTYSYLSYTVRSELGVRSLVTAQENASPSWRLQRGVDIYRFCS
jgi:hypothetical protein